jgi:transcriptional regulator with XRE-family HTH domain
MKENANHFYAAKLYKLRREADIKQPQLAAFLGISQQAYSKLERGETNFSREVIEVICKYFKIPIEDFRYISPKSKGISKAMTQEPLGANLNIALYDVIVAFLDEMKSNRTERQFYMQQLEKLIQIVERRK